MWLSVCCGRCRCLHLLCRGSWGCRHRQRNTDGEPSSQLSTDSRGMKWTLITGLMFMFTLFHVENDTMHNNLIKNVTNPLICPIESLFTLISWWCMRWRCWVSLTSSSLNQDRLSAVSTNQYSFAPPFMMLMLLMVSQPLRMTWRRTRDTSHGKPGYIHHNTDQYIRHWSMQRVDE